MIHRIQYLGSSDCKTSIVRIDHMLPLNDLCVAAPMDPLAVPMDDLELLLGLF